MGLLNGCSWVDVLFSLCEWLPVLLLSQGLNEWRGRGRVRVLLLWFWLLARSLQGDTCKVTGTSSKLASSPSLHKVVME